MDLDEAWNISEGPWCTLTQKNLGKSPKGFRLRVPKCVLFCFLLRKQHGLLAKSYPAPTLTILKIKDVNRLHVHKPVKYIQISALGFPDPKTPKKG